LIGIAIVATLAHAPLSVAGTDSISTKYYFELEKINFSNCQSAGTLPQGTSAIRVGIEGLYFSPPVTVSLLQGSHILREGNQIAGGIPAPNVTVHVKRLAHTVHNARICMTIGPAVEPLRFYGLPNRLHAHTAKELPGASLHLEYLRPGPNSWWSLLPSIAYHMGLGHTPNGSGVVYLVIVLMLAVIVISSRLIIEELR
jgi:hypothetical protein